MAKKQLQIDVKGYCKQNDKLMTCVLSFDGRDCCVWITEQDYHSLVADGFFIRNPGKVDSANILNTTKVFIES